LSGSDGDDTLDGGRGFDILDGGDDDDVLIGGNDADQLTGGDGNDTLYVDNDDIVGGFVDAGAGSDKIIVQDTDGVTLNVQTVNAEWVVGDAGADNFDASSMTGPVTLEGASGGDSLTGSSWDDSLDGGANKDTLIGGDGNDTMLGGDHDDTLDGGAGDDSLTGDSGDDVFVMTVGMGNDTIADFKAGGDSDQIDVGAFGVADWTSLQNAFGPDGAGTGTDIDMSQVGGNAGDVITIEGVIPSALLQADFVGVP
jgi:Ca2+-binding RTX toxin-like protein